MRASCKQCCMRRFQDGNTASHDFSELPASVQPIAKAMPLLQMCICKHGPSRPTFGKLSQQNSSAQRCILGMEQIE